MSPENASEQTVEERLEQVEGKNRWLQQWIGDVERQNTKLKRIAIATSAVAALAAVGCVFVTYLRGPLPERLPLSQPTEPPVGRPDSLSRRIGVCERELGRIARWDKSFATQNLQLVDATGSERAALGFRGEVVVFRLSDTKGTGRVCAFASDESASIWTADADGKPRLSLSQIEAEGPRISLKDRDGTERVVLGSAQTIQTSGKEKGTKMITPTSSILLFGKDRKVIWSAP